MVTCIEPMDAGFYSVCVCRRVITKEKFLVNKYTGNKAEKNDDEPE